MASRILSLDSPEDAPGRLFGVAHLRIRVLCSACASCSDVGGTEIRAGLDWAGGFDMILRFGVAEVLDWRRGFCARPIPRIHSPVFLSHLRPSIPLPQPFLGSSALPAASWRMGGRPERGPPPWRMLPGAMPAAAAAVSTMRCSSWRIVIGGLSGSSQLRPKT